VVVRTCSYRSAPTLRLQLRANDFRGPRDSARERIITEPSLAGRRGMNTMRPIASVR